MPTPPVRHVASSRMQIGGASGGLGPTLSIVVPLLAAFFGATAGGLARLCLDRLSERAEFRAAVWVMGDDLGRLQAHLESRPMNALGVRDHPSPDGMAWEVLERWSPADRRVLARGLQSDPDTWIKLRAVAVHAPAYRAVLANRHEGRDDALVRIVRDEQLTKSVAEALAALGPHLGWSFQRRFKRAQNKVATPPESSSSQADPGDSPSGSSGSSRSP